VVSDALTNRYRHAASTVAISSRESCFSGAALDFDIISYSVQLVPCCRYTAAPYAQRLVSAKMCKVGSDLYVEEVPLLHYLGNS